MTWRLTSLASHIVSPESEPREKEEHRQGYVLLCMAVVTWTELLPLPMMPTVLSASSSELSHAAVCVLFLNFSRPGMVGHFHLL
jgi:hypothetical protein